MKTKNSKANPHAQMAVRCSTFVRRHGHNHSPSLQLWEILTERLVSATNRNDNSTMRQNTEAMLLVPFATESNPNASKPVLRMRQKMNATRANQAQQIGRLGNRRHGLLVHKITVALSQPRVIGEDRLQCSLAKRCLIIEQVLKRRNL